MNFANVLSELTTALELSSPPSAEKEQVVFDIDGLGQLRVMAINERVLFVLSRPRMHPTHPSREALLKATHFTKNRSLMLLPLELQEGADVGFCISMSPEEATASTIQQALESMAEVLTEVFT